MSAEADVDESQLAAKHHTATCLLCHSWIGETIRQKWENSGVEVKAD